MTPTSRKLVSVIAVVSACSGGLAHFDGRAFAPVRQIQVGQGWLAVDSCELGVHALVELEINADQRSRIPNLVDEIGLALDDRRIRRPTNVQISGPFCWPNPDGRLPSPEAGPPGVTAGTNRGACTPTYLVRAEFNLTRLPTPGSRVVLLEGGRRLALRFGHH